MADSITYDSNMTFYIVCWQMKGAKLTRYYARERFPRSGRPDRHFVTNSWTRARRFDTVEDAVTHLHDQTTAGLISQDADRWIEVIDRLRIDI